MRHHPVAHDHFFDQLPDRRIFDRDHLLEKEHAAGAVQPCVPELVVVDPPARVVCRAAADDDLVRRRIEVAPAGFEKRVLLLRPELDVYAAAGNDCELGQGLRTDSAMTSSTSHRSTSRSISV